jgi:hypothetical protein
LRRIKIDAESADGRQSADDQGDDHPAEKQENHPSRGQGQKVKRCITEFESGKNFGQPRRGSPPWASSIATLPGIVFCLSILPYPRA